MAEIKNNETVTGGIFIAEIAVNYTLAVIAKQQTSFNYGEFATIKRQGHS